MKCKTCLYINDSDVKGLHICRRFPPQWVPWNQEDPWYPKVNLTEDGCGEWRTKNKERKNSSHNKPSAKRRKAAASHIG